MAFSERFLAHPDLFPARRSGEPWGAHTVVFALPGGPYRFLGLAAVQAEIVAARFSGSLLPPETPAAVESLLFRAAPGDFLTFDTRGWEYALDTDFASNSVRLTGLSLAARLDWRPGLAGALWTSDAGSESFAGIFENFFRVLTAYRLLESGGALVHAAGIVKDGLAFLFLGRSGAGKTTLSRMAEERGGTVLSDDLNALTPGPAGAVVAALPFTGDLGPRSGRPATWPLGGVFRLEQSAADEAFPLSRAAALAALVACSPFVNVDPYRHAALLHNHLALFPRGGGKAYGLRFSLGGGFWTILDRRWPI